MVLSFDVIVPVQVAHSLQITSSTTNSVVICMSYSSFHHMYIELVFTIIKNALFTLVYHRGNTLRQYNRFTKLQLLQVERKPP